MHKNYFIVGSLGLCIGVAALLGYGFPVRTFWETGEWQVTYYIMLDDGIFGDLIGTDIFLTEFDYDPLTPAVENVEPIGFKSSTEINVKQNINIDFTIGADDGVIVARALEAI